jgi:hypothetical protein
MQLRISFVLPFMTRYDPYARLLIVTKSVTNWETSQTFVSNLLLLS